MVKIVFFYLVAFSHLTFGQDLFSQTNQCFQDQLLNQVINKTYQRPQETPSNLCKIDRERGLLLTKQLEKETNDQVLQIYKKYISGDYLGTLDLLNKFKPTKLKFISMKHYWQGLCNLRIQAYPLAVDEFKKAINLKNRSNDIYYEYGQAQYANNDLEDARKAFLKSYTKNFKPVVSLYYAGHISQMLEEYDLTKKYYQMILSHKDSNKKMNQVAQFQLAETEFSILREDKNIRDVVKNRILPAMDQAIKHDSTSDLAGEIKKRQNELRMKYHLHPHYLRNGRRIPSKPYMLYFSQKAKYDDNVTYANDLPSTVATKKDSFVFDTKVYGRYRFVFLKRFLVKPELKLTRIYYSQQNESDVFQNDSYTIEPGLNNQYEHKLFKRPATLSLDYTYNYTARDRMKKHENIFYAYSNTLKLTEKFKYFSFGDTSLAYQRKNYSAYQDTLHNRTNTFTLNQIILLPKKHLLMLLVQKEYTDMINDTNETSNSVMIRFDYIIPKLYKGLTLQLSHAYTALDTEYYQNTRGTEKTYNPSIKISRKFIKKIKLSLGHSYTKKTSKDNTKAYAKNVTEFEFKYSF